MTPADLQKHILDVATGRERLHMTPEEIEEYIQEQYRALRDMGVINAEEA